MLTAEASSTVVTRITHESSLSYPRARGLAVVAVHTRGASLGTRVHKMLCEVGSKQYTASAIDISFFRDDVAARGAVSIIPGGTPRPVVRGTDLPFDIDGATVILVDDVSSPGAPSAPPWSALFDYGRPASSAARGPGGPRPPRAAHPARLFVSRTCPRPSRSGSRICTLEECDGVDEVVLVPKER